MLKAQKEIIMKTTTPDTLTKQRGLQPNGSRNLLQELVKAAESMDTTPKKLLVSGEVPYAKHKKEKHFATIVSSASNQLCLSQFIKGTLIVIHFKSSVVQYFTEWQI